MKRIAVDERAHELALVEQMDALRRRVDELRVAALQVVRRQDLGDEDAQVHREQQNDPTTTAMLWRRSRHHIIFHCDAR